MSEAKYFRNPAFIDYARLLHQLHRAIREGWDETDRGEMIRERMDDSGRGLSREEIESLNGISADFYSLSEMAKEGPPAVTPEALGDFAASLEARKSSEFHSALALLRTHAEQFPAPSLAYLRGRVWLEAGEYDIAHTFLEHAADLEPANSNFRYMALHSLWKADPDRAAHLARTILADSARHSPELVLKAADIVAREAPNMPADERQRELTALDPTVLDSRFRLETSGVRDVYPDLLGNAVENRG